MLRGVVRESMSLVQHHGVTTFARVILPVHINESHWAVGILNVQSVGRLLPRHLFFGGRTGCSKIFHECSMDEVIRYLDVTSLYPYINRTTPYPLGVPKILRGKDLQQSWRSQHEMVQEEADFPYRGYVPDPDVVDVRSYANHLREVYRTQLMRKYPTTITQAINNFEQDIELLRSGEQQPDSSSRSIVDVDSQNQKISRPEVPMMTYMQKKYSSIRFTTERMRRGCPVLDLPESDEPKPDPVKKVGTKIRGTLLAQKLPCTSSERSSSSLSPSPLAPLPLKKEAGNRSSGPSSVDNYIWINHCKAKTRVAGMQYLQPSIDVDHHLSSVYNGRLARIVLINPLEGESLSAFAYATHYPRDNAADLSLVTHQIGSYLDPKRLALFDGQTFVRNPNCEIASRVGSGLALGSNVRLCNQDPWRGRSRNTTTHIIFHDRRAFSSVKNRFCTVICSNSLRKVTIEITDKKLGRFFGRAPEDARQEYNLLCEKQGEPVTQFVHRLNEVTEAAYAESNRSNGIS
ncbi:hypothetical protein QR680_011888 [Steinernema hermaphroditum]|uniref:DNA-directed DNA polymerase n=1 Tax=Steinernema hermaphroditum TaxID=289476 RepID=A0AA39LZI8_9BILA|nr:hypothetical protein QR680_011888 [Steinernema hermaphroditum]